MLGRQGAARSGSPGSMGPDTPATLTLSPGGPWGPSPPDVPWGETELEGLRGWAKGQATDGALGATHLSSRLPSGASGPPLTPWTLEEGEALSENQGTALDPEPHVSPALTVGPRSPRGPDFPDRPW